jgi:hypothetical protein
MSQPIPTLHDSFTEKGLWWLPSNESQKVGGILNYDPNSRATLELLGALGDEADLMRNLFAGEGSGKSEVIWGLTPTGTPITLMEADGQKSWSSRGFPTQVWRSTLVVVGVHMLNADNDEIFSRSTVRFEGIENWLGHNGFEKNNDDTVHTITLTGRRVQATLFAKHRGFEVWTAGAIAEREQTETLNAIEVRTFLSVKPITSCSLNWHLEQAQKLRELASMCAGHDLALLSFEISGPPFQTVGEKSWPTVAHVYLSLRDNEKNSSQASIRPVVSGPELVGFNEEAVQIWFDQYEVFDMAIKLFFVVNNKSSMMANIRFLLAMQALEVFHRRTNDETILPKADFKKIREAMTDAIPSELSSEHREALTQMSLYSNELSLKMRLSSIMKTITNEFGSTPVCFEPHDIKQLVNTRNYYTHFNPTLSEKSLDGAGMYWAARRIVMLLTILFLRRLVVPATDIKRLLERHTEFRQLWTDREIGK